LVILLAWFSSSAPGEGETYLQPTPAQPLEYTHAPYNDRCIEPLKPTITGTAPKHFVTKSNPITNITDSSPAISNWMMYYKTVVLKLFPEGIGGNTVVSELVTRLHEI
jgi:hypothetical protein